MSSARDDILAAVRAARPADTPAPDLSAAVAAFPPPPADLVARFAEVARAGGAGVIECARREVQQLAVRDLSIGIPRSEIDPSRASPPGRVPIITTSDGGAVVSMIDGVTGTIPMPSNPHGLASIDRFLCEGVLGVAENGAIWLPESRLGVRAALFLAAQVIVVLDRRAIVPDMHAAYARLDVAAEPFGAFVSGPSKTADIEQSLVVGAHGPKALTVLLVDGG